ncbi:hypothetical protein [Synechococcus sp. MIT S9510]|uniref:hypothetical protein n=1 Tax=unclassified Synechococcus TaxID=2626047 RepID=UPI0039B0AFE3
MKSTRINRERILGSDFDRWRLMKQRTATLLLIPSALAALAVLVGFIALVKCDSTLWNLYPSKNKPCLID